MRDKHREADLSQPCPGWTAPHPTEAAPRPLGWGSPSCVSRNWEKGGHSELLSPFSYCQGKMSVSSNDKVPTALRLEGPVPIPCLLCGLPSQVWQVCRWDAWGGVYVVPGAKSWVIVTGTAGSWAPALCLRKVLCTLSHVILTTRVTPTHIWEVQHFPNTTRLWGVWVQIQIHLMPHHYAFAMNCIMIYGHNMYSNQFYVINCYVTCKSRFHMLYVRVYISK